MAYDRYDRERRWREDDRFNRDWERRREDMRFRGQDERDFEPERGERGFFERMGDEFRSWFGDERDERERPGRWESRWERRHDEPPRRWERGEERGRAYRPMTGDYARSGPERELYRPGRMEGSPSRMDENDPHYSEWRRRQLEALDRDYDEYRRERQSRFEEDFGSWRERRQSKRQMLRDIREHMEVVGSDGEHVGTIDRVAGDRIILTRSDPQSGGVHHSLSCTDIERIEGDRVVLELKADQARERWRDESRERALFEREDQGSAGPHILDRSFSGTYR